MIEAESRKKLSQLSLLVLGLLVALVPIFFGLQQIRGFVPYNMSWEGFPAAFILAAVICMATALHFFVSRPSYIFASAAFVVFALLAAGGVLGFSYGLNLLLLLPGVVVAHVIFSLLFRKVRRGWLWRYVLPIFCALCAWSIYVSLGIAGEWVTYSMEKGPKDRDVITGKTLSVIHIRDCDNAAWWGRFSEGAAKRADGCYTEFAIQKCNISDCELAKSDWYRDLCHVRIAKECQNTSGANTAATVTSVPLNQSCDPYVDTPLNFHITCPQGWQVLSKSETATIKRIAFGQTKFADNVEYEGEWLVFFDASGLSMNTLIDSVGGQFGNDRRQQFDNVDIDGRAASHMTVTTTTDPDWYYEGVFLRGYNSEIIISNISGQNAAFADFYKSFGRHDFSRP